TPRCAAVRRKGRRTVSAGGGCQAYPAARGIARATLRGRTRRRRQGHGRRSPVAHRAGVIAWRSAAQGIRYRKGWPARDREVPATRRRIQPVVWEALALALAAKAGISVAESRVGYRPLTTSIPYPSISSRAFLPPLSTKKTALPRSIWR